MKKRKAFLSGITGMDGANLSEYLLSLNYEVFGIMRRHSVSESQDSRIANLNVKTYYGDLLDQSSLERLLTEIQPDEIYNLAAMSHVKVSFDVPQFTFLANSVGVLNILEAYRKCCPNARFYQASSCLPAGTKVLCRTVTKRFRYGKEEVFRTLGTKNIEEINVGDEVLSMDLITSKKEYCKVRATGNRVADDMFTVRFSNSNSLRLSGNHPVYVVGAGYVRTDELKVGDKVIQKRYPGLHGSTLRIGKTNKDLYGKEKAAIISERCSQGQKDSDFTHPWKGKSLDEYFANNPEKRMKIKEQATKSHIGILPWNTGIATSQNEDHKASWERASKNISISNKKLWENETYAKEKIDLLIKRKPKSFKINKMESKFLSLINEVCPDEFSYNEDGKLLILGRLIPDFVNVKGKKKLIEFDGEYWHSMPGRKKSDEKKDALFKKNGYEILRISDKEFIKNKDAVKNKVLTFVHNPSVDIIEITSINTESPEKVYDIEVEKNHNFFAKGILVHNSEMFGSSVDPDGFQRESTPLKPVSPYGVSKLAAFEMVNVYRESYGLYCCSGVLFNHSGKYRGSAFVEQKICKSAVRIKLGLQDKLELGNLNACRDIGNSKDYVRAMWLILQQPVASNYVVSTGETWSIKDILIYVYEKLGLDWMTTIHAENMERPNELKYLKGDSSRIRALGWKPEFTTAQTLDEMINFWMTHYMVDWKLVDVKTARV
jgi:GDP-D-mannose dehydratase/intein/homing endonuclease